MNFPLMTLQKRALLFTTVCLLVLSVLTSISASKVFGATDDFLIQSLVGSDIIPPTIPGNFTATPIATTQINLSWDVSTDNVLLSGYHVWRDGVQIATTSILTYSDTGLLPSTLYTYYVTAFDSTFNESASSTSVATSTLSVPIVPTTTPSGTTQGTRIRPLSEEIFSLEIFPQKDSVVMRYETEGYVRSVVKWGRTTSYELGSLAEQAFSRFHETTIVGLLPNTTYYFTIEGENKIGRYGEMHTGTFTTLLPDDIFPPSNVTNLRATKEGDDIVLSWINPPDLDFSKVRVLESDQFYPVDIADGWIVYEGDGSRATSNGEAFQRMTRYYTVFAYDALGNISSGAVVRVYLGVGDTPPKEDIDPTLNDIALTLNDIEFIQDGIPIAIKNSLVRIDGAKQLTISIPYTKVPEHLKTILVVIGDSRHTNQEFSFLLRINKGKTAYTGTLAPFGVSGNFPIQISIFDFNTSQIGYTNGTLSSQIQSLRVDDTGFIAWITNLVSSIGGSYVVLFIVLLTVLTYMGRRLMQKAW